MFPSVCESPICELCAAGGLGFVRRSTGESPAVADESAWLSFRAAEEWILSSQARYAQYAMGYGQT